MSLECLLLDKALVAQVALVCSDVGMDQNVTLHVGKQSELATTDSTLMLLHSLQNMLKLLDKKTQKMLKVFIDY